MTTLHIDFETFSAADLPAVGLDNYASDPTTGVHCMAWAFDDEPVSVMGSDSRWWPQLPDRVADHIRSGGEVVAHNASFELVIWNRICVPRYGWPLLSVMQMRCTMVQCYAMGLPGSLEKAAIALGINQKKDVVGARVMMQLAKPKADGSLWQPSDDADKFARLYAYCKQDVEVEREIDRRTMRLSEYEQRVWQLDQIINQRGVHVDLRSIDVAMRLVDSERARLDRAMLKATDGVVGKCTEVQLLVKWIKTQGVELKGLAKADVLDALRVEDLPKRVAKVLRLRQEAAKSSTAKLVAMKNRASRDGRVRGTLQYHGSHTGRWAGRGIQVQNFPRPRFGIKPKHVEDMIANLHDRDYLDLMYGPPMDAMADSLRGMITAGPGHELIAMDFSAIEARVLAWLAGQESVLDIFRTHGLIYEHAAAGIYRKPMDAINKDERQIGKVAVLALGYGGGVGAFQSMARAYGVQVADERADQIKRAWREAHPKIVRYWYDLEDAAINAAELGVLTRAGVGTRGVAFRADGSFLWCRLPSGRVLCYPYPSIQQVETPWGERRSALAFYVVTPGNKWEQVTTYGGSLAENLTQAVARDLLADAMLRMENAGMRVVFHAHDEVVVEVPKSEGEAAQHLAEKIMSTAPAWADGLPLAAEGWRAFRYRK